MQEHLAPAPGDHLAPANSKPALRTRQEHLLSEDTWDAQGADHQPTLAMYTMATADGNMCSEKMCSEPPSPEAERPQLGAGTPGAPAATRNKMRKPRMEPDERTRATPARLFKDSSNRSFADEVRSSFVTLTMGQLCEAVSDTDFTAAMNDLNDALARNDGVAATAAMALVQEHAHTDRSAGLEHSHSHHAVSSIGSARTSPAAQRHGHPDAPHSL